MSANFTGKVLKGTAAEPLQVEVDGGSFVGTHFEYCALIYRGGKIPNMDGATTNNCNWNFKDAAAMTVHMLAYLELINDPSAKSMIETAKKKVKERMLKTTREN